jgi:integrase
VPGSMRLTRGQTTWELRIFLGRDSTGQVRHRYATFHGTKREASAALDRLSAEVQSNPIPDPGERGRAWGPRTTINDAISGWRDNGWEDLSPSTIRRYESIWRTHIKPSIGSRQIATLSPFDVEQFFRQLKDQGLSRSSVRQTRAILHRACRLARRWSNNTLPNPLSGSELPSWHLAASILVRAPTKAEVKRLLKAAKTYDDRFGIFLRVVSATGARRGEACALRWSDIDLETGTLTIDESVVAATGGAKIKEPKTHASLRQLAIDPGTASELRRLRSIQQDLADSCGLPLRPDGFLFSSDPGGGTPPYPDTMSHAFSKVRETAGVSSDVHLHSLRHFHATNLDSVIPEAQKQARLGWATVRMARHYTATNSTEDRQAARHIGRLLGKP